MAKRRAIRKRVRTDGAPRVVAIDGKRNLYIVWSENGRSGRVSTGTDRPELAAQRLVEWMAARTRPPDAPTVDAICAGYVEDRRAKPVKDIRGIESALRPIRAHFGALQPDAITPAYVRAYVARRRKSARQTRGPGLVSDRRIAIELAHLRAALRWAERERWIDRAPPISVPAGSKARTRYLTGDEITRLQAALTDAATPPHLRLFVVLAMATGQRSGAIRALRWEHIDLERGIIWFSRTEERASANKRRQDVPLSAALRRVLEAARAAADGDHVVSYQGAPVAQVARSWRALLARAGLADVRIHDLRRTVATVALANGATFAEVAALLSDDERIVRRHYAHVAPALLETVIERVEGAYAHRALTSVNETALDDTAEPETLTEDE